MALLFPFRAVRPDPRLARQLASVPYDVVSTAEARELARREPHSFLRVTRPEVALPEGADPHSDAAYNEAHERWEQFLDDGWLVSEAEPRLFVYRLRTGAQVQTGIAGTFSVDEYESGLIARHERTRKDKEDDRTRHIEILQAQTGPVFLAFRSVREVAAITAQVVAGAPLIDFTAEDGVSHTLWTVPPEAEAALVEAFAAIPRLYIADGHHRAAAAARVRALEHRMQGPGPWDRFLAVAFPAEELRILPYHRAVRDLNGRSPEAFLRDLSTAFSVRPVANAEPAKGEFAMRIENVWYSLKPRGPAPAGRIASLDVSVLQDRVLGPILGIADPRTDSRIEFIGGSRGTAELERRVASGHADVAFALHATSIDELLAVSDAGEIMPPKSTWFEPKLRDGLLVHSY